MLWAIPFDYYKLYHHRFSEELSVIIIIHANGPSTPSCRNSLRGSDVPPPWSGSTDESASKHPYHWIPALPTRMIRSLHLSISAGGRKSPADHEGYEPACDINLTKQNLHIRCVKVTAFAHQRVRFLFCPHRRFATGRLAGQLYHLRLLIDDGFSSSTRCHGLCFMSSHFLLGS